MSISTAQMGNVSSNGPSTTTEGDQSSHVLAREVVYGVMAALSFLLNSLFCVVMMRRPTMMKRPHNILLFTLALADLLTGLYSSSASGFVLFILTFSHIQTLIWFLKCGLHVFGCEGEFRSVAIFSVMLQTMPGSTFWVCERNHKI